MTEVGEGTAPMEVLSKVMQFQKEAAEASGGPGSAPALQREFDYGPEDYKTDVVERFGLVLSQDFQNMGEVQKGMKSRGLTGCRTNPLQESTISNFHRALYEYLSQ